MVLRLRRSRRPAATGEPQSNVAESHIDGRRRRISRHGSRRTSPQRFQVVTLGDKKCELIERLEGARSSSSENSGIGGTLPQARAPPAVDQLMVSAPGGSCDSLPEQRGAVGRFALWPRRAGYSARGPTLLWELCLFARLGRWPSRRAKTLGRVASGGDPRGERQIGSARRSM